jgi:hypothetical protein
LGKTFVITERAESSHGSLQVHVSPKGNRWAVLWREQSFQGQSTWKARFFDQQCLPVSAEIDLSIRDNDGNILVAAMDDLNRLFLAWRAFTTRRISVISLDDQGNALSPPLVFEETPSRCNNASALFRLAVNPANGFGVLSCQGAITSTTPIAYRRFQSNANGQLAWSDAAPSLLAPSQNSRAPNGNSHLAGMNRQGVFVIAWQVASQRILEAAFFDATGTFLRSENYANTATLSGLLSNQTERIPLIDENFALRGDHNLSMRLSVFDSNGVKILESSNTLPSTNLLPEGLRSSQNEHFYLQRNQILKNPFTLVPVP